MCIGRSVEATRKMLAAQVAANKGS